MDKFEIKTPGYYIVKKDNGQEQIVKYYQEGLNNDNEKIYYGYYGINSYHEVVSLKKNMRELTKKEHQVFSQKKYWSLPQQFYHSFPEC